MIVATRDGGVLQGLELSQEQKETALAAIFRSFCQANPHVLDMGGRMQQEPAQASE